MVAINFCRLKTWWETSCNIFPICISFSFCLISALNYNSQKNIHIIVRAITTFLYIHSIHKKWLWNIILTKISAWNLGLLLQILCLSRAPDLQHYNLQLIIVNWILQLRIWIGLFWSAEGSIAPSWHFVNLADLCKLKDKYENRTTATYKLKCFERTRFSTTSEGGKFVKFQMASTKLSHHVYLYQIEY